MSTSGRISAVAIVMAILVFLPAILRDIASNIIFDAVLPSNRRAIAELKRERQAETDAIPPQPDNILRLTESRQRRHVVEEYEPESKAPWKRKHIEVDGEPTKP